MEKSFSFGFLCMSFVGVCQILCLRPYHTRPRGYKTFFVLNSAEYEFFLLINVEMPTIVGILTFMSGKNIILDLSEPIIAVFYDIILLMST